MNYIVIPLPAGGICGIASAAAALNHFDTVTLFEKDDPIASPDHQETVQEVRCLPCFNMHLVDTQIDAPSMPYPSISHPILI